MADVDLCFEKLRSVGIEVSQPQRYPEYHPEYYAIFFEDLDGIRLEIVAQTSVCQALESGWSKLKEFLNPLQALDRNNRYKVQQHRLTIAQRCDSALNFLEPTF